MGNSNNGNRTKVDQERQRADREYQPYTDSARGGPNGDFGAGRANELRDRTLAGYSGGGGYNPQSYTPQGGNGERYNPRSYNPQGGGGEKYSSASYNPSSYNPSDGRSSYGGDANWNNSLLGDTGSARSTYENFSSNGGVDATALRNRATAQIPGFYDQFKQAASRRASTQGGYSPGFDAQQAEIGRQAGREGFNASRQVEGDIADKVMQGRLAGAAGLTGLGGMETQNNQFNTSGQYSAAEGNASRRQGANQYDQGMGLEAARFNEGNKQFGANFDASQRQFGAGLGEQQRQFDQGMGLDVAKFGEGQQQFGANFGENQRQFNRGMGLDEAKFGEGQRQFGAEFGEGQRRFNQSGIADMYGRDQDNYYRNMDNYRSGIQGRSTNNQNLIGMRTEPTSRWGQVGRGLVGAGRTALSMYGGGRK